MVKIIPMAFYALSFKLANFFIFLGTIFDLIGFGKWVKGTFVPSIGQIDQEMRKMPQYI